MSKHQFINLKHERIGSHTADNILGSHYGMFHRDLSLNQNVTISNKQPLKLGSRFTLIEPNAINMIDMTFKPCISSDLTYTKITKSKKTSNLDRLNGRKGIKPTKLIANSQIKNIDKIQNIIKIQDSTREDSPMENTNVDNNSFLLNNNTFILKEPRINDTNSNSEFDSRQISMIKSLSPNVNNYPQNSLSPLSKLIGKDKTTPEKLNQIWGINVVNIATSSRECLGLGKKFNFCLGDGLEKEYKNNVNISTSSTLPQSQLYSNVKINHIKFTTQALIPKNDRYRRSSEAKAANLLNNIKNTNICIYDHKAKILKSHRFASTASKNLSLNLNNENQGIKKPLKTVILGQSRILPTHINTPCNALFDSEPNVTEIGSRESDSGFSLKQKIQTQTKIKNNFKDLNFMTKKSKLMSREIKQKQEIIEVFKSLPEEKLEISPVTKHIKKFIINQPRTKTLDGKNSNTTSRKASLNESISFMASDRYDGFLSSFQTHKMHHQSYENNKQEETFSTSLKFDAMTDNEILVYQQSEQSQRVDLLNEKIEQFVPYPKNTKPNFENENNSSLVLSMEETKTNSAKSPPKVSRNKKNRYRLNKSIGMYPSIEDESKNKTNEIDADYLQGWALSTKNDSDSTLEN